MKQPFSMLDTESNAMPIAIIGMGCRFAGNATNLETLWQMLEKGESAWSEIPSSRFNLEGWYHPNHENISTVIHNYSLTGNLVNFTMDFQLTDKNGQLFRQMFGAAIFSNRTWPCLTQPSSVCRLKLPR
jgi:hypothetical protein